MKAWKSCFKCYCLENKNIDSEEKTLSEFVAPSEYCLGSKCNICFPMSMKCTTDFRVTRGQKSTALGRLCHLKRKSRSHRVRKPH